MFSGCLVTFGLVLDDFWVCVELVLGGCWVGVGWVLSGC